MGTLGEIPKWPQSSLWLEGKDRLGGHWEHWRDLGMFGDGGHILRWHQDPLRMERETGGCTGITGTGTLGEHWGELGDTEDPWGHLETC